MNINDLEKGQSAIIISIDRNIFLKRLLDMGLTKGTIIKVIKRAPLNNPIEIEIKGFHLALRIEEAKYINVEIQK